MRLHASEAHACTKGFAGTVVAVAARGVDDFAAADFIVGGWFQPEGEVFGRGEFADIRANSTDDDRLR